MQKDDIIYRQQAIDAINALHEKPNAWLDSAVDAVMTLPSAQPERKKGEWLVDEDGNMECPFCGNTCGFGNYCNECGADLRGE